MSKTIFLAADFSGIQRYVLGVKSAGKAQAKRLRARSFQLELLEHAALQTIQTRLKTDEDDVLVRGGGGFLLRVPRGVDPRCLEALRFELGRQIWEEFGGEIGLSLAWDETAQGARDRLEHEKRRPASLSLQENGRWRPEWWSRPPIDQPCQVCGRFQWSNEVEEEDERVRHCERCLDARRLGEELTQQQWVRAADNGPVQALGVRFELLSNQQSGAFRVQRSIPRETPSGKPLTFEEIAAYSRGAPRLAVLKADVDDMGLCVGKVADKDPSYRQLRSFSRTLHGFFGETVQNLLSREWSFVYTVYSGGDDLLLVGPWDVMLDFASALADEFQAGPAREHGPLTLSAGIALTPYRVPIRHAVERAEQLLERAKQRPGKDRCAALGADWTWIQHRAVIGDGKRLTRWIETGVAPRALVHRLLRIIESEGPQEKAMREARWVYQVERNVSTRQQKSAQMRLWVQEALSRLERDGELLSQSAASLRYALLATRSRGGEYDVQETKPSSQKPTRC